MFGPRNSAYAVNLTYETYRQHISREISIEHPSVGLASLAQLALKKLEESKVRAVCRNFAKGGGGGGGRTWGI